MFLVRFEMKVQVFITFVVLIISSESFKLELSRKKRFSEYDEIAKLSGGIILDVEKYEKKSTELLVNLTTRDIDNKIYYTEMEEAPQFTFDVDSKTEETYVIVNSRSNVKEVTLASPSGAKNEYVINANEASLFVAAMKKPAIGRWTVSVSLKKQSAGYKAIVAAKSPIDLSPIIYNGEKQIDSGAPLTGGETYLIQASFMPKVDGANVTMTCLDERRRPLCDKHILGLGMYFGYVQCPDKSFFINFEGILEDGSQFQRWIPSQINVIPKADGVTTTVSIPETSGKLDFKNTTKGTPKPKYLPNSTAELKQISTLYLTFQILKMIKDIFDLLN